MNIYLLLFLTFFKIGAFTFGGGYAMLPLVEQEVMAHAWMSEEELVNFIAVSEATPGPFAINVSTYVGTVSAGFWGAVCATVGVVLPSFIVILVVGMVFDRFQKAKAVKGMMFGLHPAVVALIASSFVSVGKQVFFTNGTGLFSMVFSFCILAVSLFLALKRKTHPIKLIVLSAVLGIVCGYCGLL